MTLIKLYNHIDVYNEEDNCCMTILKLLSTIICFPFNKIKSYNNKQKLHQTS